MQSKLIVISLGGSVMAPDGIDSEYLKQFNKFIRGLVKKKYKFVIVVGGGKMARRYQDAAEEVIGRVSNEDKDWIGIHATRMNAQLLRTIFKDVANPVIFDHPRKFETLDYPVTIGAGWRPGWSTDYVTASIAVEFGAKIIVNAGKPTHVFDKDPHVHPTAKHYKKISWKDYGRLIPKRWTPGMSSPIDPIATSLCSKQGIKAFIVNGKDLINFRKAIEGKDFEGTVIA